MSRNLVETKDVKEIQHFSKLSTEWWDEFGEMKLLHAMNKLRIPFVRDGLINTGLIAKERVNTALPLEGINILEVGCGGGILSEPLARTGAIITGIDLSDDLIHVAKHRAGLDPSLSKLTYKIESVEEHAINNSEKYDAVVASEVVEHVNEQEIFLKNCIECLKPGGSIFITTLNKTTMAWLVAIIGFEYVLNCIPRGTHDWEKFIVPEEIIRILKSGKCKTILTRGQSYNIFNHTWSWTNNKSVFYVLQAVKE